MTRIVSVLAASLALAAAGVAHAAGGEPVVLRAADGVTVYGEVWRAAGAKPPLIVAFHQAESSSAEYAPIAPRLVAAGFTVLAIDQRSGDGAFGGSNRTAAALGRAASYDEALPDLAAALAWAKADAKGAPVIVWGSSYSAALAFVLAAAHPGDVDAIVAFSPGEYLAGKQTVRSAAAKLERSGLDRPGVERRRDRALGGDPEGREDERQAAVQRPGEVDARLVDPARGHEPDRRRDALAGRARVPGRVRGA